MIDPEFSYYYTQAEDKALFMSIYQRVVATWDDFETQPSQCKKNNKPVTVTELMPEKTKKHYNLKVGDSFRSRASLQREHNVVPSVVHNWYKRGYITLEG